ncbi:MAG: DUF4347 domain-containing protein, partial [Mariniblastus sp.]|nr:DUF4347 domain-containing protein [Mariniblastus sp.]
MLATDLSADDCLDPDESAYVTTATEEVAVSQAVTVTGGREACSEATPDHVIDSVFADELADEALSWQDASEGDPAGQQDLSGTPADELFADLDETFFDPETGLTDEALAGVAAAENSPVGDASTDQPTAADTAENLSSSVAEFRWPAAAEANEFTDQNINVPPGATVPTTVTSNEASINPIRGPPTDTDADSPLVSVSFLNSGPSRPVDTSGAAQRQLVVVDPLLDDVATLLGRLSGPHLELVQLADDADPLVQIEGAFGRSDPVSAVHIFSHGSAGNFTLGNLTIDRDVEHNTVTLDVADEHRNVDETIDKNHADPSGIGSGQVAIELSAETPVREIVFVDDTVRIKPEGVVVATALDGALAADQVKLVRLSAGADSIGQITAELAGHTDLSAIHLVTHGSSGVIDFGEQQLATDTLQNYVVQLQVWADSLAPEGDILVYGCDVGQGNEGAKFVKTLATLTEADVAASTDPTGPELLGGNWYLETAEGVVERRPLADIAFEVNQLLRTTGPKEETLDASRVDPKFDSNNPKRWNHEQRQGLKIKSLLHYRSQGGELLRVRAHFYNLALLPVDEINMEFQGTLPKRLISMDLNTILLANNRGNVLDLRELTEFSRDELSIDIRKTNTGKQYVQLNYYKDGVPKNLKIYNVASVLAPDNRYINFFGTAKLAGGIKATNPIISYEESSLGGHQQPWQVSIKLEEKEISGLEKQADIRYTEGQSENTNLLVNPEFEGPVRNWNWFNNNNFLVIGKNDKFLNAKSNAPSGGQSILVGGDEADELTGSKGQDQVRGGKGIDILNVGDGEDVYLYKQEDLVGDTDIIVGTSAARNRKAIVITSKVDFLDTTPSTPGWVPDSG